MAGAENSSCRMTEQEKDLTAYHEAGHMIVGRILESEGHDPVYKVTITPRGRSMGVTMFLPERDQVSLSYEKAQASMATGFGGRIAEEMFYGWKGVTTGASQDLAQVTDMATRMVTEWGWSPKCGPMTYTTASGAESYVGRGNVQRNTSNETAQMVDSEIRAFIDTNYKRAEEILKANRSKLIVTKDALRKWETIDRPQIDAIMEGKTLEEIPEPAWVSVVEAIADEVVATAKDTNPVDLTKPEGKQE
jgi:cell division protease FtsH